MNFERVSPVESNRSQERVSPELSHGYAHSGSDYRPETELAELRAQYKRLLADNQRLRQRVRELEDLVNIDPQTGLPIRRSFVRHVENVLASRSRETDSFLTVGIIRLDSHYRRIRVRRDRSNALLVKASLRMRSVVGDQLYQSDRFDEFLFVYTGASSAEEAMQLGRRIADAVAMPHDPPAEDINFGCTVGLSVWPRDGESLEALLDAAGIAIDSAESGADRVILYSEAMGAAVQRKRQTERAIARSLNDGFHGFFIEYQPIVTPDGTIDGAEALIRLRTQELGLVSPSHFIPITEENGEIRVLGQWVLFNGCRQLQQWRDAGFEELTLTVNLSPVQFKQPDLARRVDGVLKATNLEPGALKLELTESMLMDEPEVAIRNMNALRELGVTLLVDDFGTGYSSLGYLRRLPIDVVKIDKSFVDRICEYESDRQIVRAIVSMAESLQLSVLAEGVEHVCQLEFLRDVGCNLIQGYYFSRPASARRFLDILQRGKIDPGAQSEHSALDSGEAS